MQNRRTFIAQCGAAGVGAALLGPLSAMAGSRCLPDVTSFVQSYGESVRTYQAMDAQGAKVVFDVQVSDLSRFTNVFNGSPLPFEHIHCDGNRMQFQTHSQRVELIHHVG